MSKIPEYVKPILNISDEPSEGVYMHSGSKQMKCESKYMNGIPQKPTYNSIQDGYKVGYGCDGCPAWNGTNHCKFIDNNEEMLWAADFRPSWEKRGHLPDEKGY